MNDSRKYSTTSQSTNNENWYLHKKTHGNVYNVSTGVIMSKEICKVYLNLTFALSRLQYHNFMQLSIVHAIAVKKINIYYRVFRNII